MERFGPTAPAKTEVNWEPGATVALVLVATLWAHYITDGDAFATLIVCGAFGGFAAIKLALKQTLSFRYLTIPSVFIAAYIVMMALPAIPMYAAMDNPIKTHFLAAVESVLIVFPLGLACANLFEKRPADVIRLYCTTPLKATAADLRMLPFFRMVLVSAAPILVLFFIYSSQVQLIEVIAAYPTNVDKTVFRFAQNDLPQVIHYAFELLRRMLLPICTMFAFFMSLTSGGRWSVIYWPLFLATFFVASLTLDRAPPSAFFVMMFLAWMVSGRKGLFAAVVRFRTLRVAAAVGICGGIISVFQYQSDFTWDRVLSNIWYVLSYRIIQDPTFMAAVYSFQNFPAEADMLGGSHIRLFSLFGQTYVESLDSDPRFPAAPVTFVGDLWRNWGWEGVILGAFLIGFIYQLLQLKLFREKTPTTATFHVLLLINCIWIIPGNFLGIMTTSIIILSVLIMLLSNSAFSIRRRPAA